MTQCENLLTKPDILAIDIKCLKYEIITVLVIKQIIGVAIMIPII